MAAITILGLVLVLGLALALLFVGGCGAYGILRQRHQLRRRADLDYRAARGTQHLRMLRRALPNLQKRLEQRRSVISDLETRHKALRGIRSMELQSVLSHHLVRTRLTEVPGIGPKLSARIIAGCFRNRVRDLNAAYRISGVGAARHEAIMTWVHQIESEFPELIKQEFPGRQAVLDKYRDQDQQLTTALGSERLAFERDDGLYQRARQEAVRLEQVSLPGFRKALRAGSGSRMSTVPGWYFQGVYAPWEPMPEWFETLLAEHGGRQ